MKKIVFCDYDGTFYTDEKSVQLNVEAVKRFRGQGGKFVIATGRGMDSIDKAIGQYSIPFDYLILNNGAFITNNNKEVIFKKDISAKVTKKAAGFIENNFRDLLEGIYYYGFGDKSKTPEDTTTKMRAQTFGKSHSPAEEIEQAINRNFPELKAHATWTDLYPDRNYQIVDITNAEISKETAIDFVLRLENLSDHEATAVGDSRNDVSMIQKYNGYAMEQSEDRVKEVASGTVESVAELVNSLLSQR